MDDDIENMSIRTEGIQWKCQRCAMERTEMYECVEEIRWVSQNNSVWVSFQHALGAFLAELQGFEIPGFSRRMHS